MHRLSACLWFSAILFALLAAGRPVGSEVRGPRVDDDAALKTQLFSTKVVLDVTDASLIRVLNEVFRQTSFDFLYAGEKSVTRITEALPEMTCGALLDTLARRHSFRWERRGNTIVVSQERKAGDQTDIREYACLFHDRRLSQILPLLQILHPFKYKVAAEVDAWVVNVRPAGMDFTATLAEILARCDPPMRSKVVGGEILIVEDRSISRSSNSRAGAEPRVAPGPEQVEFRGKVTLDDLISALFNHTKKRYRIDPAVTDTNEIISFDGRTLAFDEMLSAILASAPGVKGPLTFRMQDDVYIIAPKGTSGQTAEVVFPTQPGDLSPRSDYALRYLSLGDALRSVLKKANKNYWLQLPDSANKVTITLKNATVIQALRAVTRCAEARTHLGVLDEGGVYCVVPDQRLPLAIPAACTYSGTLNGLSAYDACNIVLQTHGNYRLDYHIKSAKTSSTFKDVTFDECLRSVARGTDPGLRVENDGRMVTVKFK